MLIVSLSDLLDARLSIESLSNGLVGLHELVKFLGKLLILVCDHSYVVVQGVDFNLKVGIIVEQSGIAVAGSLQLLSHVHDLVLLGSYLCLEVLDAIGQLDVS